MSTILNPPNKDRTSTFRATYTRTAVTVQSAGTEHKRAVPYHPEAPRNRVKSDPKRDPPPFSTTLKRESSIVNQSLHPYRTISAATQAPGRIPMHMRLGFTNGEITRRMAEEMHKPVYS
ncbi:hypothetical protein EON67_02410 [archaeon]|nr:MAG: hypothetical protein EON67_02410 [archaeon]